MEELKRLLTPPVFEDEDKRWAAWLFNLLTLSVVVLLSLFVILRVILGETQILGVTNLAIAVLILIMIGLQLVMRRGYVKIASAVLIGFSWLTLVYMAWDSRGVDDTALTALLIVILLANLLINWQSGVALSGLSILAVWAIAYIQVIGVVIPKFSSPYPLRDALDLTVVFAISTLVMILTTVHLKNSVTRARQSERELTLRNRELQLLGNTLEQQVDERTRRLEVVAQLSGQLTTILNVEQLLTQMVNQIKEKFGYYHVHVYLMGEQRQELTVAAGVGEAGAKMKAAGHHIMLNAPTSLVARAARSGQIVKEDDVRQAEDWLPNALLPDTYSEMAVPISLEGRAIGVLDVQSDKIAGLNEGDANLLHSLANQVAIAIQNARNFERVEAALTKAQAVQERYTEQVWQKAKISAQVEPYLYIQPGAAPLDEAQRRDLLARQRPTIAQGSPVITSIKANGVVKQVIVAPINLQGRPIGALQLQSGSQSPAWEQDDLAIIEAIIDQAAQTAENLRLFEETRERADYEQLVGNITQKLRQAPTMDILTKTAAEELGRVLGISHSVITVGAVSPEMQTPGLAIKRE